MKNCEGSITISRVNANEDYVEISIRDDISRTIFVEAKMSLEEFTNAITGIAARPCKLRLRGLEKIGKRKEVKSEVIDFKKPLPYFKDKECEQYVQEIISPYEIEGWTAPRAAYYASNHHNRVTGNKFKIVFERYIDVET